MSRRSVSPAARLQVCGLLASSLSLAHAARAQQLPLPAAQPQPSSKPLELPTPVPGTPPVTSAPSVTNAPPATNTPAAPAATSPPPFYSPAPPSEEEPIIIGEPPVRNSYPVAPTPAPGVASVGGVIVGRLGDSAALLKMKQGLDSKLKSPVRLVVGEYQYTFLRSELGAEIPYFPLLRSARAHTTNIPLTFKLKDSVLLAALRDLDTQVRQDFGNTGINVGGSMVRLKAALEISPTRDVVQLPTVTVVAEAPSNAEKAAAELQPPAKGAPSAGYPYLLADFATHYDGRLRGRTTNLKIAARNMNGTVIEPNGVFSANSAIGPRDAESGWKEAMMFVSGRVVSGVGSGICQTASTLYNVALLADLPIVERHPHSMRVTYVPPSRDAALLWHSKDLKFRNDTPSALLVQTFVAGGKFHARLWSSQPRTVPGIKLESHIIKKDGAGLHSEAFKIENGKKTRLSRDFYKPHP